MRGRFHPDNGQLYVSGLSVWATNQTAEPGGLYRVRATGQPVHVPVGFHAYRGGLDLDFSAPLDAAAAADTARYKVTTWSLVRSEKYGSPRSNVKTLAVAGVHVSSDGKSLRLALPGIAPTHQIEITYTLRSPAGEAMEGTFLGTIHALGASSP
jgi:hypothetical protein